MSTISLDIDMTIQEAMDTSIRETFSMMIGEELEHIETTRVTAAAHQSLRQASVPQPNVSEPIGPGDAINEATVVVGLSGGLQGSISVCLEQGAAFLWTERLIDHKADHLDQTVIDAIGELGNMVVGGAKGRLEDFMLTLGLPSVLLAGPSRLAFPSNCVPTQSKYRVAGHNISVFISLVNSSL